MRWGEYLLMAAVRFSMAAVNCSGLLLIAGCLRGRRIVDRAACVGSLASIALVTYEVTIEGVVEDADGGYRAIKWCSVC